MKTYRKEQQETNPVLQAGGFLLEALMLQGAEYLIQTALVAEVEELRETHPDKPYRNGYGKLRKVATPSGTLHLQAPRLRIPIRIKDFGSLQAYQRTLRSVDAPALFAWLIYQRF